MNVTSDEFASVMAEWLEDEGKSLGKAELLERLRRACAAFAKNISEELDKRASAYAVAVAALLRQRGLDRITVPRSELPEEFSVQWRPIVRDGECEAVEVIIGPAHAEPSADTVH
jgi:hypothetical protein